MNVFQNYNENSEKQPLCNGAWLCSKTSYLRLPVFNQNVNEAKKSLQLHQGKNIVHKYIVLQFEKCRLTFKIDSKQK